MDGPKPTRQQRDIIGNLNQTLGAFQPPAAQADVQSPGTPPSTGRRKNPRALIVAASRVRVDPSQVRQKDKEQDAERIQELARSIAKVGLQQPPGVRETTDGLYEIVYGEGRFVAMTKILGWHEVEVIRVDAKEEDLIWHQLHENIHRTNLDPLDLAAAVAKAREQGHTLAQIADRMGKSETWAQKAITVGQHLSEEARELLSRERQAMDAVYAIAQAPTATQADLAREVVEKKLNRRQTQALADEAKTRRDGAERTKRTGRKKKSKPFETTLHAGNGASITVKFRKTEVAPEEIAAALEEALLTLRHSAQERPAA